MADKTFPARQRCRACRGKLGGSAAEREPVYFGLYCSTRCAKLPALVEHAVDAPRGCKTFRENRWVFKRRYRSEFEIPDLIKADPSSNTYWCEHCGHLHSGHSRLGEAEAFRSLKRPEDLQDFLVKRRGSATRAQVAQVAGVRPIRLKELETGVAHPENLQTLFKVLTALGSNPGVVISTRR